MNQYTHQNKNQLVVYRRRMGLPQKAVANLLGHSGTSMISRYEKGRSVPPLLTALKLEIIYRTPVAFLYPSLYETVRNEIRQSEQRMAGVGQQSLFPLSTR